MSYTAEELLSLAEEFEKTAADSLVKSAKAKETKDKSKKKLPFWLNKKKNTNSNSSSSGSSGGSGGSGGSDCYDAKDDKGKKKPPFWMKNKDLKDSNSADTDPKAKVRNRGNVCVPAESAKDKKDHFPINDEAQARNALARVNQFSSVPEWYSGSLQSLVSLVAKKVHAKYPGIKVSKDAKTPGKKKSSYYDVLLNKFAEPPTPSNIESNNMPQLENQDEQKIYQIKDEVNGAAHPVFGIGFANGQWQISIDSMSSPEVAKYRFEQLAKAKQVHFPINIVIKAP